MKKIESFQIDHENLFPGLYVSRRDESQGVTVTTFDLRLTAPNKEPCLKGSAIHTIEHIGATYLRSSSASEKVVYFGPMGCKTGFYLVMFGYLSSKEVFDLVVEAFRFIENFDGEIPGATSKECGNYAYQNLALAKEYAGKYVRELVNNHRLEY